MTLPNSKNHEQLVKGLVDRSSHTKQLENKAVFWLPQLQNFSSPMKMFT